MNGPLLWYLDRATGLVLLVLLTLVTALGVLSARGSAGGRVPAFVRQHLHRNLALLSVALLAGHITFAVIDDYVDIRWWQAFAPFIGPYKPLWIGLGAVAVDVLAVVTLTSLARARFGHQLWRGLHLTAYLAWPAALAHGLGMGTDTGTRSGAILVAICVGVVTAALSWRLAPVRSTPPRRAAESVRGVTR